MTLARKLAGLAQELRQGSSMAEKLFRLARRTSHSVGLSPALSVECGVIVELLQPPPRTPDLADLRVRRAQEADIVAVAAIDNRDWNRLSRTLHQRLGFTTIGRVTALGVPGLKWLRWEGRGRTCRWLLPRNSDLALPPATI
jgi:hypothetical protein